MGSFYAIDPTFQEEKCQVMNDVWTLEFDGATLVLGQGLELSSQPPPRKPFTFNIDLSTIV
jgi:hypothetical protein